MMIGYERKVLVTSTWTLFDPVSLPSSDVAYSSECVVEGIGLFDILVDEVGRIPFARCEWVVVLPVVFDPCEVTL